MSIFDYECEVCGTKDERIVPASDPDRAQACDRVTNPGEPIVMLCNGVMKKLWTAKKLGAQFVDSKKLPNGDVCSRARIAGSPNTWDRRPTKFREGGSA